MGEPRLYRTWQADKDLVSFSVMVKETDLFICTNKNLKREAEKSVKKHRKAIENYIKEHKKFLVSLNPIMDDGKNCPEIVKEMIEKSAEVGVGPMATVAGAIAEYVGKDLLKHSSEVIVENGGDIFLKSQKKRVVGLFSGKDSVFSQKIGLEINPTDTPLGICTSSGIIGHSLSFGESDAVVVVSSSTPLADAAATKIGNCITDEKNIKKGIELAKKIRGLRGLVIVKNDKIGLWGDIKIVQTV